MNITGFKLPKKKAPSATAMKMLQHPTVDRKNKVAENRLSDNIHELEMEYQRLGASHSREKVTLIHELRDMREELEKEEMDRNYFLELPSRDPREGLMSPAPVFRSPRPTSRSQSYKKRDLPEITIEEADEPKEEEVPRLQSRRVLPKSSKEERAIEQRMNNIHKRFALQANSQKSIQELQRKNNMSQEKSSKGRRTSNS